MKAALIKGTIKLTDGSESEFQITSDGNWFQWGATTERLGESVDVVEALAKAAINDELLADEPEDDER
ncbi:hypothetical protein [Mycobacteroides abscessus]|uniref:hypothetical protein n=1 Tax=Mycobacteroides abscessus TaxID=36809 RepID=UPI0009273642|nr:hypothetical protein [Mycobacteroides abscessus]SIB67787.1 Uncharacterised protein [Mycobacteroides abscessus subsp. abscessus]